MKLLAAVLLVCATATTAAAQKDDAKDLAAQDCARARKLKKQCVLSFEGEDVRGKGIGRGGHDIGVKGDSSFANLIRLRWDFRAEIIKAAEDL